MADSILLPGFRGERHVVVLPGGRLAVGIIFWGLYIAVSRDVQVCFSNLCLINKLCLCQGASLIVQAWRGSPQNTGIVCHLLGKGTGGL